MLGQTDIFRYKLIYDPRIGNGRTFFSSARMNHNSKLNATDYKTVKKEKKNIKQIHMGNANLMC